MLLRMISSLNKWDANSNPIEREDASYPADSVTDLKTTRNKLSVWKANSDAETNDAIVAMALGRTSIDKLCFVYLDETELSKIGIEAIQDEPGLAPGMAKPEVLNRHMNLQHLDYMRLGNLTGYIFNQIDSENCIIKTKKELVNLLASYKENGIVTLANMNDQLKKSLKW